jgi:hypothetical protein
MEILETQCKSPYLNTLEKFHIFKCRMRCNLICIIPYLKLLNLFVHTNLRDDFNPIHPVSLPFTSPIPSLYLTLSYLVLPLPLCRLPSRTVDISLTWSFICIASILILEVVWGITSHRWWVDCSYDICIFLEDIVLVRMLYVLKINRLYSEGYFPLWCLHRALSSEFHSVFLLIIVLMYDGCRTCWILHCLCNWIPWYCVR